MNDPLGAQQMDEYIPECSDEKLITLSTGERYILTRNNPNRFNQQTKTKMTIGSGVSRFLKWFMP